MSDGNKSEPVSQSNAILEVAREYVRRGWAVVPIPYKKKKPIILGWQTLRLSENDLPEHFGASCNIGVLLGEPSGGLIDVDLDHPVAVELAPAYLPPTQLIFGRAGKPRSHFGYRTARQVATKKWKTPKSDGQKMIVELRSTGCQTVFPPSVHLSGEPIQWESNGEPAVIDADELRAQLQALASEVLRRLGMNGVSHTSNGVSYQRLASSDITERARRYLSKVPPAVSGQAGHDSTFYAACRLVLGFALDRGQALGLLREWNQSCQPPWSEKELAHKVDEALQQPGERGYLLNGRRKAWQNDSRPTERRPQRGQDGPAAAVIELRDSDAPHWPDRLDATAYHGLAGDIVRAVIPHSEADPVALLIQTLAGFGNVIGRTAHFRAEADRHYCNLFSVLVGQTSKARKGTSWGHVRRLLDCADVEWAEKRILTGLSSGEGLIWTCRDPIMKREPIKEKGRVTSYQDIEVDPGEPDKRLLVYEAEFAGTLRVLQREGNTLSAIIRQAWESGNLRTLTKHSQAIATGAHVSIVGHITGDELRRYLSTTEMANGFGNRFLWLCVQRSKCLPEGGRFYEEDAAPLVQRLADAIACGRETGEMRRDADAAVLWRTVYAELSEGKPGMLGAILARAEAQVMRLATCYALLDLSNVIRREHLLAGLALWEYCEASARYIFGDALGDAVADDILKELRATPPGMTRTDISNLLGRHTSAERIARALRLLEGHKLVRRENVETDGRPAERWFAATVAAKKAK